MEEKLANQQKQIEDKKLETKAQQKVTYESEKKYDKINSKLLATQKQLQEIYKEQLTAAIEENKLPALLVKRAVESHFNTLENSAYDDCIDLIKNVINNNKELKGIKNNEELIEATLKHIKEDKTISEKFYGFIDKMCKALSLKAVKDKKVSNNRVMDRFTEKIIKANASGRGIG